MKKEEGLQKVNWLNPEGVKMSVGCFRGIDFVIRDWFSIRIDNYLDLELEDLPVDEVEGELREYRKYLKYYNEFIGQQSDAALDAQLSRLEARIEYKRKEVMYKNIYENNRR